MTTPSTARKAGPLLGTGSQTAWPFTFKVFAAGDVKVTIANSSGVETVLVLNTDYSVTLNANQDTSPGGTITYPISGSALPVGSTLTMVGDLDYDQPLDLPSGGNFSPLAIENQLDREIMQIQQLKEQVDRSLKFPVSDEALDPTLPTQAVRAGTVLAFHETTGEPMAGPSIDTLGAVADALVAIDTVATNVADVVTVADNIADVNTVATNIADVNVVVDNLAAVQTVASDLNEPVSEINTVAVNIVKVNAVGDNIADVVAVADNMADVNTLVDNLAAVNNVSSAITNGDLLTDVYQGAHASDPTTRLDGSALQAGDLYFNTAEDALRAYSGTVWVSGTAGSLTVQNFSGDAATTAFTLGTAPAGENNTQVYVSGVYQQKDTYSVSGTTLTFSSAPPTGTNNIEVVTVSTLSIGETDAALVSTAPAGGLWTTVQGFITWMKGRWDALIASTGSSLVGFIQAGTGAAARTAQDKLREYVSVKDFGAVGDGATDDTAAIQDAINSLTASGGTVFFPKGTYKTDSGVTLASNVTLRGETGAVIKPSDLVPSWAFRGVSTNNVTIEGLTFEGTGTAYSAGTQRLLQVESGAYISIRNCTFTKSRESGVVLDACTYVHISDCNFIRNYVYGGEARNGCANVTIDSCAFELNGNTGTASSAFGRGFVLWNCSNSTISNSVFHQNTEYGLRLYSQTGDADANRNIAITGCSFRDNGTTAASKNDLYIYNEHGGTERVAISGCTFSVRSGNFGAVLSGNTISLTGCTFKAISPQEGFGVSLYGSTNVVVSGNTFVNLNYVAGFSATAGAVSTNCTLSNNQCLGLVSFTAGGVQGVGHIISNNYIKHGGAGASDVGITLTSANISATITGNVLDGFYRAFNLASTGDFITIKDNRTVNSTGSGCFAQYQTDVSKIICTNNSFDSAYPIVWATMFSDSAHSYGRKFFVSNSTPAAGGVGGGANIVWKVGDRVFNSAPVVGQPKSWVCTVAGAPGTWVSEGNL